MKLNEIGRSAIDTVRKHRGDLELCGGDDKAFISRIHVADIVNVIKCSMMSPNPGGIYNLADDMPSTRYEVLSYACKLLQYPVSKPEISNRYKVTGKENGVRGGSKRVDNSRMQRLLELAGSALLFADYRSGLKSILTGEEGSGLEGRGGEGEIRGEIYETEDNEGTSSRYSEVSMKAKIESLESQLAGVMSRLENLESQRQQ